ncbi:LysR substrate-binding domain-containing protein [Hoeflea sp. YIM 152468]|uniref:LysR substrate-binding domain-containing protein n=1 Tax=Hoeflea sp. YIM 152468 TaxID=3031759 RepID=UPI0023DC9F9A|nr:LysR substrate-binding domain-containing protein [Hoeflea sp. YIM 152468]MDF1607312.1 LysR substrate-binding domain-containing protein [Hoeflea sp. YIM 152468]
MRLPNLNGVRAFDCAARHLNFRLAAGELNLTQGAVAQQVRKLETALGQKLFVRKPRGLELSETGAAYFAEIHAALIRIDQATARLVPASHSVVLSVPPSFAGLWLMPRLSEFEALHPDIDLQVLASEKLSDLEADGVDLVVRQASPPFAPDLQSVLLTTLDLVAVASPAYLESAPPSAKFEDFRAHRLLEDAHRHWQRRFGADDGAGHAPRVSRFNQTALAIAAARAGRGIAIAPEALIALEIESGALTVVWRDEEKSATGFYAVGLARPGRPAKDRDRLATWLCGQFGVGWG